MFHLFRQPVPRDLPGTRVPVEQIPLYLLPNGLARDHLLKEQVERPYRLEVRLADVAVHPRFQGYLIYREDDEGNNTRWAVIDWIAYVKAGMPEARPFDIALKNAPTLLLLDGPDEGFAGAKRAQQVSLVVRREPACVISVVIAKEVDTFSFHYTIRRDVPGDLSAWGDQAFSREEIFEKIRLDQVVGYPVTAYDNWQPGFAIPTFAPAGEDTTTSEPLEEAK